MVQFKIHCYNFNVIYNSRGNQKKISVEYTQLEMRRGSKCVTTKIST